MNDRNQGPPEITEDDLLAYLDGRADPELTRRIQASPALRAEVAAFQETEALLRAALARDSCPAPDDLLAYQAGLLDPAAQRSVAHHLSDCAACRADLAELAEPMPALAPIPPPAGPSLRERLQQAGKALLTALLVQPSAQPALALRGREERSLTYQAGDYELVLALIPPPVSGAAWQLEGQLLGSEGDALDLPAATIHLYRESELLLSAASDEFGYFFLEAVPPGTYALHAELPQVDILIEELDFS